MPSREVGPLNEGMGAEKRKPVRRDPERRRLQNNQAQKRYRGKLRERLDRLEAFAASAAQNGARPPASGADGSRETTTSISTRSVPAYDSFEVTVSPSSAATPGQCQQFSPLSDETPSVLGAWDTTIQLDPSVLIRKRKDCPDPYCTATGVCGCYSLHMPRQAQGPNSFRHTNTCTVRMGQIATAADPYTNNLRIEMLCTTAALSSLGISIGITIDMVCADQSLSPFYLSSVELADSVAKANIVWTVQSIFKTLKPDLRPSREQITVNHHPYIDILPFPTLRKNLITHQEDLDEDEFFQDMLTGLVCWGGAGIGRKDRGEATGNASTGTPWDVRSWEAKPWFLTKYWTLLGCEDGELVRQSEWWRSLRGIVG